MKLSVSLSEADVQVLDEYVRERGLESRSAAVQHAVRLLRTADLGEDYAAAWDEWVESGDQVLWESTVADGRTSATG